jgi:predicted HTH transcriptional regulator
VIDTADLLQLLARGEDSRRQFKRDATNADGLAAELAAFDNSGGCQLLLGVNDDGSVAGLDAAAVRRLNQLLGNAATQHVRPPIHPLTQNIPTTNGIVIVVEVPDGLAKPYVDTPCKLRGHDRALLFYAVNVYGYWVGHRPICTEICACEVPPAWQ